MKVLIVGAGAVGQVFGAHLQRGGAEVAFFVKDKYAAEARAGYTLTDLGRRHTFRFEGFDVLTTTDEVGARKWDLVLFTVASPALRQGTWVEEIVRASGDATIVGMQPGLGDPEFVRGFAGADRVVWGMIELIAYQSPLPGESLPVGVAYWIPAWLTFPFSGPEARTMAIVNAFRAGGLRSKRMVDAVAFTAVGAPFLNLHIAALEVAGWSLTAVRKDRDLLRLASAAVREAVAVTAAEHGVSKPIWLPLVRPATVALIAWLAPRVMPLDIETYLKFHFTKVGAQTRQGLERWIALAAKEGRPHGALTEMRDRLLGRAAPAAEPHPVGG